MNGRFAARAASVLVGVLLAAVVVHATFLPRFGAGARRDLIREWAPDEDVALWHAEWERRAPAHLDIGDPPGSGPVQVARYWLSRGSHVMEVRRRGERFVLKTYGVDEQTLGGGWAAVAAGRIRGGRDDAPFAGAVATFSWSCLGVRHRYASGGIGRLEFDRTGATARARYVAHEEPDLWLDADAILATEEAPPRGTLAGQVLAPATMARFRSGAEYSVVIDVVERDGGPIREALVQLLGVDATRVRTNEAGRAEVHFRGEAMPVAAMFCAGHPDYFNGDVVAFADDPDARFVAGGVARGVLRIELDPRSPGDDPRYRFVAPHPDHDADDVMACGTCHMSQYQEWLGSRHARMDDHGHVEYERGRLASAGHDVRSCDGCHRPGAALEPSPVRRGLLDANHCDLCHKIAAVGDLRESGVFGALRFARPSPDAEGRPGSIHLVFGSRPDVTYAWMGASFNPLFAASHLCAGCHQGGGVRGDDTIAKIDTFEEWRRWAAERGAFQTSSCQDCHMRAATSRDRDGQRIDQLAWDGLHRSPDQVHAHDFTGVTASRLGEALETTTTVRRDGDAIEAVVRVTNRGAGHKVPTGTFTKHLVLGVWATSGDRPLALASGPRAWLDPRAGEDAGREPGDWRRPAGFVFGISARRDGPGPFHPLDLGGAWTAADVEDTRLEPGASREFTFRFDAPGADDVSVIVQWQHRRGALGAGPAEVAWPVRAWDPPPALLLRAERVAVGDETAGDGP